MSDRPNKATICSVVFLDILGQSSKPVVRQVKDKELFNSIIDEAVKDVAQHDRIQVDTSNGKVMALFGAPEAALFIAMMMRDAIIKHNNTSADKLLVRTGISIGPVRLGDDLNGLPNMQGDGVNAAERIKNLAGPNQILVSRAYHDIISGLTDEIDGMFFPFIGEEAYSVRSAEEEPFVPESVAEPPTDPVLFSRLLNDEDSPRYGLWGSAALVAAVMLVGGFMLLSNGQHPDLGDVIAESKPAVSSVDSQTVSAPDASTSLATIGHEIVPNIVSPADPELAGTTVDTPPVAMQLTKEHSLATHPTATSRVSSTAKAEPLVEAIESDPIANVEEAEPETQVVIPQEKEKKVAAAPRAGKGPIVEDRPIPSSGYRAKTIWDDFRASFKQGSTQPVCTQAEMALNQCK